MSIVILWLSISSVLDRINYGRYVSAVMWLHSITIDILVIYIIWILDIAIIIDCRYNFRTDG